MGFFSKIAKKVKKQVKRSSKQVKKQVKRSSKQVKKQAKRSGKQIKKQAKRSYDDAREMAQKIEPYVSSVLSVVDPTGLSSYATNALFGYGGYIAPSIKNGGGKVADWDYPTGTLQINPYYPTTGGTPLGQGQFPAPPPGQAFGGRPVATGFRWSGVAESPFAPTGFDARALLLIAGAFLLFSQKK